MFSLQTTTEERKKNWKKFEPISEFVMKFCFIYCHVNTLKVINISWEKGDTRPHSVSPWRLVDAEEEEKRAGHVGSLIRRKRSDKTAVECTRLIWDFAVEVTLMLRLKCISSSSQDIKDQVGMGQYQIAVFSGWFHTDPPTQPQVARKSRLVRELFSVNIEDDIRRAHQLLTFDYAQLRRVCFIHSTVLHSSVAISSRPAKHKQTSTNISAYKFDVNKDFQNEKTRKLREHWMTSSPCSFLPEIFVSRVNLCNFHAKPTSRHRIVE